MQGMWGAVLTEAASSFPASQTPDDYTEKKKS